jgi:hypothetical protein
MRMTKEQKLFEARVERCINLGIQGYAIDIMKLSDVSKAAKAAAQKSTDDNEVVAAVHAWCHSNAVEA